MGLNKLYQLQFNNSLTPSSWSDIVNKVPINTKLQVTA